MSALLPTMDAILRLRGKLNEDKMSEEARRRANHTIVALAEDISTTDIIRILVAYRELTLGIRDALKVAEKSIQDNHSTLGMLPGDFIPGVILKQFHYRVSMLLNSSVQIMGVAGDHHGPTDV